jgi:ATP-dependent Zn protease
MAITQLTKQLYSVKTLVDLNNDLTNFKIKFTIQSETENTPFQVCILDETTLNHTETIKYETVQNGILSGEVASDKNKFQKYYLILRADNPVTVRITLNTEELPEGTTSITDSEDRDGGWSQQETSSSTPSSSSKLVFILIASVILCSVFGIAYFMKKGSSNGSSSSSLVAPSASRLNQSILAKLKKAQQTALGNNS